MRVLSRSKLLLAVLLLVLSAGGVETSRAQSSLNPGFAEGDAAYEPKARAGREIWFFATAYNDRFFTYSYPQRLGVAIDWYKILAAKNKEDLFQAWGVHSGSRLLRSWPARLPGQNARGDLRLPVVPRRRRASQVRRQSASLSYRDPACDFKDAPSSATTPHGASDQRQSPCDLQFGTSTGALGLRKFPNPRFDAETWRKLNGSLATWEGYGKPLSDDPNDRDSRATRLFDGSIEPPFRIGMAAARATSRYDPLKPPADPEQSEMGEHRRRWSATSTAASRSSWPRACPSTRWSGS